LFDRYKRLELQWYLSFDIKPIDKHTQQSNIIHMTVGDNSGKYGSRTPFVEFHRSSTRIVVDHQQELWFVVHLTEIEIIAGHQVGSYH